MFNVGGPEIFVIFLVALIVLGPQQLPKAMRTFGNVMGEVRKVSSSFQAEMKNAMDTVVDTSATEKPKSASMAAQTPSIANESQMDEVVARNEEEPVVEGVPLSDSGAANAGERPAVDPADRAAG